MAEEVNYFKLGLFFLISLGLLVIGIIGLGAMDYFQPTFTVETYIVNQSLMGLEVGAPVKLEGITKGRVTEINIVASIYHSQEILEAIETGDATKLQGMGLRNSAVVRMEIEPEFDYGGDEDRFRTLWKMMVDTGLRARLAQSGLAGPRFMDLEFLDPELYPAEEPQWTPKYLYIPSAPSITSQLMNAATVVLSRLQQADFTAALEKFEAGMRYLDEFSEKIDIEEIRDEAVTLTKELRQSGQRLRTFLNDPRLEQTLTDFAEAASHMAGAFNEHREGLGQMLETIPRAADRLERVAAQTEKLLEDERIERVLDGMSEAAGSAEGTMDNAEATTADLRRLVRELSRLTMILSQDLNVITENLRRITEDAEIITGEMKDNPSHLIFGEPPPRSNPGQPNRQERKR